MIKDSNRPARLLSLDAFRGATIAAMVIVNSPGNNTAYAPFKHSSWNGCSFADIIFPFFIIIMGISTVLALTNVQSKSISSKQLIKKIVIRSVYLFMVGLLLNSLPNHFNLTTIRLLGVLQRIAICYFFSAILFLTTSIRVQLLIITFLLIGYWLLIGNFFTINSLPMDNNLVGFVDQWLLTSHHLYQPLFDPEGLLSTLPAIASALFGNLIGIMLLSSYPMVKKLQQLIYTGSTLMILGGLWCIIFPFNKSLWSSSYVLWTSGLACLVFAFFLYLVDIKQYRYGFKSFLIFGQYAMLIYLLHVLFLKIQAIILIPNVEGQSINLRFYLTELLFGTLSPKNASFCYALSYTLLWLMVLIGSFYRQQLKQYVLSFTYNRAVL